MDATPYAASHIRAIRPYSGPLSRLQTLRIYVPHPPVNDAAGKPEEAALSQSEAKPDTHRPWNTRLGRWMTRQLNPTGLLSSPDEYADQLLLPAEGLSQSTLLALSGLDEIGALSRYAVEKFISTLAVVQTLPCVVETPALSAAAWVKPIERLSGEYQQALLATLDETGREIIAALHMGQLPAALADKGRCRMDRLSEFYVNTCHTICQGRN